MARCSQCSKTAIFSVGEGKVPLCIDCYLKLQQAIELQDRRLKEELNYLTDSIEATVGLYGILPRYPIPKPIVRQGPVTLNNITVDRSTIGSINTGEIVNLDVAITSISKSGNENLVKALKEFTQAVIEEKKLNDIIKNQIIEQLSFLANQVNTPKERRKKGIIKAVLSEIRNNISTVAGLVVLWEKLYPLFKGILG